MSQEKGAEAIFSLGRDPAGPFWSPREFRRPNRSRQQIFPGHVPPDLSSDRAFRFPVNVKRRRTPSHHACLQSIALDTYGDLIVHTNHDGRGLCDDGGRPGPSLPFSADSFGGASCRAAKRRAGRQNHPQTHSRLQPARKLDMPGHPEGASQNIVDPSCYAAEHSKRLKVRIRPRPGHRSPARSSSRSAVRARQTSRAPRRAPLRQSRAKASRSQKFPHRPTAR